MYAVITRCVKIQAVTRRCVKIHKMYVVTVPVAQAGFGSSDVYGYGDGGGSNSMFDAATTSEAAALAAAKVPAVRFLCYDGVL